MHLSVTGRMEAAAWGVVMNWSAFGGIWWITA
jgi:hypothetical protein